jgi:hypothetical protein
MAMILGTLPSRLCLGFVPRYRYSSYYHRKKGKIWGDKTWYFIAELALNFRDVTSKYLLIFTVKPKEMH